MGYQSPQFRRKAQLVITTAATLLLFILILKKHIKHVEHPSPNDRVSGGSLPEQSSLPSALSPNSTSCRDLPGADSVLVILKTGATEAHAKLPIHFNTTFRCTPHYAIYSDLDEEILGHAVHDTLSAVPASARAADPDAFSFYDLLHAWHRSGIDLGTLSSSSTFIHDAAWGLDKWKFLPLAQHALAAAPPQTRWIVFAEADTALVWSNVLRWLARLDAGRAWYLGGPAWLDGAAFAHGGSGYVLSRPALEALVAALDAEPERFVEMTAEAWAGDYVLARALEGVGVALTPAWPMLQGETPYTVDYTAEHWCYPVVSWHHMPKEWVAAVWAFEREWLEGGRGPIRHLDVFERFVAGLVRVSERANWDNLSPDGLSVEEWPEGVKSARECRRVCEEEMEDCVQWLFVVDGTCRTGTAVRLGEAVEEVDGEGVWITSGWVVERIDKFVKDMEGCRRGDWIVG
ncbi:hypothetical protein SLS56_001167 [Neofusicoccum ribis]|uniref:Glycosyltransferase family 31 protein n=1 Tax=Neofusicoccum ribis TaxID=45134 RepID=A0ABR3TAQ2_9PEZI